MQPSSTAQACGRGRSMGAMVSTPGRPETSTPARSAKCFHSGTPFEAAPAFDVACRHARLHLRLRGRHDAISPASTRESAAGAAACRRRAARTMETARTALAPSFFLFFVPARRELSVGARDPTQICRWHAAASARRAHRRARSSLHRCLPGLEAVTASVWKRLEHGKCLKTHL